MGKTGARLTGGGITPVLIWIWNSVLPYLFGIEPDGGWPQMSAEVGSGLTLTVVALSDIIFGVRSESSAPPSVPPPPTSEVYDAR